MRLLESARLSLRKRYRTMTKNSQLSADSPQNVPHHVDPAVRELVRRAQEGSDDACRALRQKYRPLLESSVARFASADLTMQERADLHEEADRVFLGAISTYDSEQDAVDFGLYARICLRNGLISEWRRMESRRRTLSVGDAPSVDSADSAPDDPAVHLMAEESFRTLCGEIRSHLSDFENRVWWPYATGVPVAEIARDIGCDERAVHNAVYRIRRKLRERMAKDAGNS